MVIKVLLGMLKGKFILFKNLRDNNERFSEVTEEPYSKNVLVR